MLDADQRASRYLVQTGRATLTPAQRRRVRRKQGHQSDIAGFAREVRTLARQDRAARKRRAYLPARVGPSSVRPRMGRRTAGSPVPTQHRKNR
jgi:hypothetical protein